MSEITSPHSAVEVPTPRVLMFPPAVNYGEITFGIELEMVTSVCYPEKGSFCGDRIRISVMDALNCVNEIVAGLTASCHESGGDDEGYYDNSGYSDDEDDNKDPNYGIWNVSFDGSVYEESAEIHRRYPQLPNLSTTREEETKLLFDQTRRMFVEYDGIEVISRVFKLAETKIWTEHIGKVLHALRRGPMVNGTPESSGYHVHVGLGDGRFTFEAIKKIAVTVTLAESLIDKFHAPHRRNEQLQIRTLIGRAEFQGLSREAIFDKIMGAADYHEFMAIISSDTLISPGGASISMYGRAYKVNFTNLDLGDKKGTIEFRQHEGTLDPTSIAMWIRFTGLLVFHAVNLTIESLKNILVPYSSMSGIMHLKPFIEAFIRDPLVAVYYLAKIGIRPVQRDVSLPASESKT